MHKTKIQIRFSDIDALGHVSNSMYNQYLDVARYDYLKHSMGNLIDWKKHTFVLVRVENDFVHSSYLDDELTAESEVVRIGNRSVEMLQQIVDTNGVVRMKSRCVFSTFDMQDGTSFPVPDGWRKKLEEFEGKKF